MDAPRSSRSFRARALSRALLLAGVFVLGLMLPAVALTVRVDPSQGAPRLIVDGVPVRARVFWGAPGSKPLPIAPEAQEVSFEFTASGSATNGTMHFRFGQVPGDIWLDDIHIIDNDSGADLLPPRDFEGGLASFQKDWTTWPVGGQNTVGTVDVAPGAGNKGSAALHVSLKAPPGGHWPDFHLYHQANLNIIQGHRYRVTFWARATPARGLTLALYRPGQTYVHLGGPSNGFESQIKMAADAGVNIVSFPCDMPWPAPGHEADWSLVDAQCATVLRANPKALLLPRMGMGPPAWWREAHPGDIMKYDDGHSGPDAVVASPLYRHDAADRLSALVAHLEEKFGDHMAGYHPCGQNTGEWFYYDTWLHPLNGYAPADLNAWRGWLAQHYTTDAERQKAWGQSSTTLTTAAVPSPAARHAAPFGTFRDPQKERDIIDWGAFQQEAMADCVRTLAHAVRTASHGRKLVVFFYGYVFEFGAIQNGAATAGHYNLRRVLDCPDIDVLCSPISYIDRGRGQSAPCMSAAESVALAGKLWLNEDDTHTYLATGDPPGSADHVSTLRETNQELTRNLAQEACRNFGTWWMDLGATGWFDDPGMWAVMKHMNAVDESFLKAPAPYRPEVAAVLDEASMLRIAAGGTLVSRPGTYEARIALGRMGAPYGQYLLDDVLKGRISPKLYLFLDAWALGPGERQQLVEATKGAACLWCYAPGYFDRYDVSLEAMRSLTGFALKPVTPKTAIATSTPLGRRLGLTKAFGTERVPKPLFAASDATSAEVLATYDDGSAAVALRRPPTGGLSLFAGPPGLTSELLRAVAAASQVHLFTNVDCNVYANGPFIALHAAQDGPVLLDVGTTGPIIDVFTGAKVGDGPNLPLVLKKGETRVLRRAPF